MESQTQSSESDLKKKWSTAKAHYTDDTLVILGQPVMERWETPYMKALAQVACLKNNGCVLEVGYGMGISATFIDEYKISEHYIIEANYEVFLKAKEWAKTAKVKTTVINGFWQDITKTLKNNNFDGIIFDVFPLTKKEFIEGEAKDFYQEAYRLLRRHGILTFYYDLATSWYHTKQSFLKETVPLLETIGFQSIQTHDINCKPDQKCDYFWKEWFLVPLIRKKKKKRRKKK